MDAKPKVSAKGTYILDDEDIDRLDELSLTSVINDVTDPFEASRQEPQERLPDVDEEPSLGDSTINQLLNESVASADLPFDERNGHLDESLEPSDDLIAPELLFSDQDGADDDDT